MLHLPSEACAWLNGVLSVSKFTANMYCICLSIPKIYTDAVQICGKFWDTQLRSLLEQYFLKNEQNYRIKNQKTSEKLLNYKMERNWTQGMGNTTLERGTKKSNKTLDLKGGSRPACARLLHSFPPRHVVLMLDGNSEIGV